MIDRVTKYKESYRLSYGVLQTAESMVTAKLYTTIKAEIGEDGKWFAYCGTLKLINFESYKEAIEAVRDRVITLIEAKLKKELPFLSWDFPIYLLDDDD